jgi:hypothetical protein
LFDKGTAKLHHVSHDFLEGNMQPVSLDVMLECAAKRRAATDCPRCGGTGEFSTVNSVAQTSSYGAHCFACGGAYKVPRKWKQMSFTETANLFNELDTLEEKYAVVDELQQVKIMNQKRADAVRKILKNMT